MTERAFFALGQVAVTANVARKLTLQEVWAAVRRHQAGDWGEVDSEDWQANEQALKAGARLLSVYHSEQGVKFWVITEWDRSLTTVLLPEDY